MIDLDALERRLDPHYPPVADLTVLALIAELREKRSEVEGFRMALTTCRQERAMAEAMVGRLERSELIDGKTLADQARTIRGLRQTVDALTGPDTQYDRDVRKGRREP